MYTLKLGTLKSINKLSKPFTNGSSLIGKVDEVLKFNILKDVDLTNTKIVFTIGTNGKTTTNNLINEILSQNNAVLTNSEGANLTTGIKTSVIKDLAFNKKVKSNVLCLEVDEKTLKHVVKVITPDHIVITNFFRDQLDRYGEIDTMIEEIVQTVDKIDCVLHLNGNDPLLVDRFKDVHNRKQYYGINIHDKVVYEQNKTVELKYCPKCLTKLEYNYYHYGHIGNFECSNCDFKTPKLNTELTINSDNIIINGTKIDLETSKFPTYFYFNILSAIEVSMEIDKEAINATKSVLEKFTFPKGRSQHLKIGNKPIYFNLSKNVVGMEETLEYATNNFKEFDLLIAFNDEFADGRDVSWIWDTNMGVIEKHVKDIYITGIRRYDMAVRIESEMDNEINVIENITEALETATTASERQLVIITNYTPLVTINKFLGEKC